MMIVVSYRVLVEDASGPAVELCSSHNSAESHGFHLRMLGNVNPDEGSTLVRNQPNARSDVYRTSMSSTAARGRLSTKQHSCETANFRHLHHQLEEAGEIEGEPHSGTRRE